MGKCFMKNIIFEVILTSIVFFGIFEGECFAVVSAFALAGVGRISHVELGMRTLHVASPSGQGELMEKNTDKIQNVSKQENDNRNNNNNNNEWSRRQTIVAAMASLSAESAWKNAVAVAATTTGDNKQNPLPATTRQILESGRAVVIPNWLSLSEVEVLRNDAQRCFRDGYFKNFILSRNPNKADKTANDRWIMNSFSSSSSSFGPFADPAVGNFEARQSFKAKMATVKAYLASELRQCRPTLADDEGQTHEMEYLRYGAGACLPRHTDEHHVELQRPNGSRLPKKPNASRRSVTWMVYLNNKDWDAVEDGGQLRLHERSHSAVTPVGSRGPDLQVGWLKATSTDEKEEPVFLDPFRPGPENENCVLYTADVSGNNRRDLSEKPFANIALYLGGGDGMARKLMVDNPADAARLHLIDAPKSLVSSIMTGRASGKDYKGEDGGEQIQDVSPQAGTLVMFDSVSLPHEVLITNKERFGIQGWFHEHLGYDA